MEISQTELETLSGYAASELAGGLLLGKMARLTKDAELRAMCTLQCAEETRHAAYWVECIQAVGGQLLETHDTARAHYFAQVGNMSDEVAFISFVYALEQIVPFHLECHMLRPHIHAKVGTTLQRIIQEESGHTSWALATLTRYADAGKRAQVVEKLTYFIGVAMATYKAEIARMVAAGEEQAEFARIIESRWANLSFVDPNSI